MTTGGPFSDPVVPGPVIGPGASGRAMRWDSTLSVRAGLEDALRECAEALRRKSDSPPDLALLFLTPHYLREAPEVPRLLERLLRPRHLLGCSAGGVIGDGRESEGRATVGLMAGWLPGVTLTPFHLEAEDLPDMDARPQAWADVLGIKDRASKPHFVVLADPFTFNPEDITRGLDYSFAGSVKVGGLASGALRPGGNALFVDGTLHRSGAIGMAFAGNVAIDPIVAQGCRPIGPQFKVTQCEQNWLVQLDGRPVLEALEELLESLPPPDQDLARHSLFLGMLNNPLKASGTARDYLIRNLVGLDSERGLLAVGALPRAGQVVQFHLRDKRTSAEDLLLRLKGYTDSRPTPSPAGALIFSCLGRGVHLYGTPNHDTEAFLKSVGPVPIAGFFCNGEIGPVDGSTYLHGYTSCFGVFRPASE